MSALEMRTYPRANPSYILLVGVDARALFFGHRHGAVVADDDRANDVSSRRDASDTQAVLHLLRPGPIVLWAERRPILDRRVPAWPSALTNSNP